MAAYVIADIEVHDFAAYDVYRQGVEATVTKFGGRFLVRGGNAEAVEGTWCPKRLIVLEFPDKASLRAWYGSPDYKPLLDMRLRASTGRLIVADGV